MSAYRILCYFVIQGDYDDDLNFEFGDGTDLHNGCAAHFLGEFWYFGGGGGSTESNPYLRQVN